MIFLFLFYKQEKKNSRSLLTVLETAQLQKKKDFFAAFGSEISSSEMLKMIKDEKHVCEICRPREMGTKHAQGWTNVSTAEERGALFSQMI